MRPFSYCKLEIFLPASHLSPLETALRQVDAGHIGAYDSCLSYSPVTSCWRPLAGTTPYLGTQGALSPGARTEGGSHLSNRAGGSHCGRHPGRTPLRGAVINVIPLYQVGL